MTKRVKLPSNPEDEAYEHVISSYAMSAGYFVDTRVVYYEHNQAVCECDILTRYENEERTFIEAKSGGNKSLNDIFKIAGILKYSGIEKGALVQKKQISQPHVHYVADELGVKIVGFDIQKDSTHDDLYGFLEDKTGADDNLRAAVFSAFRWGRHAHMQVEKAFNAKRKNAKRNFLIAKEKCNSNPWIKEITSSAYEKVHKDAKLLQRYTY